MFGQQTKAPAVETDDPATYDQVEGFKSLPRKEQILAASIYAGFRQALREDRQEVQADRSLADDEPRFPRSPSIGEDLRTGMTR